MKIAEKFTVNIAGDIPGKIDTYFINDSILYLDIDINSKKIPDLDLGESDQIFDMTRSLCINYCFEGRCELQLNSGERTYLGNGELAVDLGHTVHENDSYFYPNAKYDGIQIYIQLPTDMETSELQEEFLIIKSLFQVYQMKDELIITNSADEIRNGFELLRMDSVNQVPMGILKMDILRLVYLLSIMDYTQLGRRCFLTKTQVEIAKYVKELIEKDLSKRYSAKALAEQLNVSETSLKNYFRGVYGQGYMEYQKILRMEYAAKELCASNLTVGEIAVSCGFQNQSRFAKAFKEFYGKTPKEYIREKALKDAAERQ